jgi:hypothetical protein
MRFDLDLLKEEIDGRSDELLSAGIATTLTRGPMDRDKCAAWVDLTSATAEGQLIVWDSGEAELMVGSAGGLFTDKHYDLETVTDLKVAIGHLIRLVGDPLPPA